MTSVDAHRGPADNGECGCDTWVDERLVAVKTLGRHSSIASRRQYRLDGDRWENTPGGY